MKRRIAKIAVLVLVLAGVGAYWTTGRMDPALSQVGLNYGDCEQNGSGATLCGDDLERAKREDAKLEREKRAKRKAAADQCEEPMQMLVDKGGDPSYTADVEWAFRQKLADEGKPYAQEDVWAALRRCGMEEEAQAAADAAQAWEVRAAARKAQAAKAAADEAQTAADEQLDQQCKFLYEDADFGGLYRGDAEERAADRYSELGCSQR
jgi:hypothetical protein